MIQFYSLSLDVLYVYSFLSQQLSLIVELLNEQFATKRLKAVTAAGELIIVSTVIDVQEGLCIVENHDTSSQLQPSQCLISSMRVSKNDRATIFHCLTILLPSS
jgi:hypothetical protein